jgi:predicted PurR-regulated permease PerM
MAFLVDRQQRAALLIVILGAGLLWATWPYFSGLLGAPVLYVIFGALHRKLAARIGIRPRRSWSSSSRSW